MREKLICYSVCALICPASVALQTDRQLSHQGTGRFSLFYLFFFGRIWNQHQRQATNGLSICMILLQIWGVQTQWDDTRISHTGRAKKDVLLLLVAIYWGKLANESLDFSLSGSKLTKKWEEISRNYLTSNSIVKNKINISLNLLE